jgi:hypothetical protein
LLIKKYVVYLQRLIIKNMEENKNIVEMEDLIDGYLVSFDIAYLPNGWSLDKWCDYVKKNKFAPYDSSRMTHCGDRPFGVPVDLRRLEPSLVKRDTVTVDRQQVIEGLFQ